MRKVIEKFAGLGKKQRIIVGAVAVVLLGGVLTWALWPTPEVDPTTAETGEIADYVGSKAFGRLSDKEKADYLRRAREQVEGGRRLNLGELSEEQRRAAMENVRPVMRQMITERVDAYFELPQEEREGYLDEMIDRMDQMGGRMPGMGRGGSGGRGGGRRGPTPERLRNRIENTDPETRAKMVKFREAMRARREERGLPTRR